MQASAVKISKFKGRRGGKTTERNTPKDIEPASSNTYNENIEENEEDEQSAEFTE